MIKTSQSTQPQSEKVVNVDLEYKTYFILRIQMHKSTQWKQNRKTLKVVTKTCRPSPTHTKKNCNIKAIRYKSRDDGKVLKNCRVQHKTHTESV